MNKTIIKITIGLESASIKKQIKIKSIISSIYTCLLKNMWEIGLGLLS